LAEPKIHPSGVEYASWLSRVGAQLIDFLVLTIPFWTVAVVLSIVASSGLWLYSLVYLIATALYDGLLDGGERGQTLGKRVLKIRVMDDRTGESIGVGRGIGRSVFSTALGFPARLIPLTQLLPVLDALWPLWDSQRQCWHDKAVGSVVVRVAAEV
jgi:uncharacterized RDD family membrane protein YckC